MSKHVVGNSENKQNVISDAEVQDAVERVVNAPSSNQEVAPATSDPQAPRKYSLMKVVLLLAIPLFALCGATYFIINSLGSNEYVSAFKKAGQKIEITEKLSSTEIASKNIPKTGGQLSIGSTTLDIPAQKSSLYVTMTKIDTVSGLPSGWILKEAYEFGPDGSVFDDSIKVSVKTDSTKLYAFKINSGRLTRAILKKSADGYTAYSDSFSGIAFIEISGDVPSVAVPNEVGNKAKEIIANIVSENNEAVMPQQNTRIKNVLYAWYQTSVNKHLEQSSKDDSTLKSSITEYLSWLTKVQLFGLDEELQPQINSGKSLVTKGLVHALAKASDGCTQDSDVTNASKILTWQAITLMLGLEDEPGLSQHDFDAKLKNCTSYELDISSVVKGDDNITLIATIPVDLSEDRIFSGKGTATEGPFSNVLCTYGASQTEFPVSIGETQFLPKISADTGVNINLILNLDDMAAQDMTYHCSDNDTYDMTYSPGSPQWSIDFSNMHGSLAVHSMDCYDCYQISDWEYIGKDSIIATKTLNGSYSVSGVTITGETKFTLKIRK